MDWIVDRTAAWTGLLDWITGFNLVTSHDFHPIKFAECDYLTINCTSSSHCMLGNVHDCTLHKLHRRMFTISSWCELTAPSDCSKYVKEHQNYWQRLHPRMYCAMTILVLNATLVLMYLLSSSICCSIGF